MYDAITVVAEVVTECIEGKGRVSTNEPSAWSYDRDDIFKRFKEVCSIVMDVHVCFAR